MSKLNSIFSDQDEFTLQALAGIVRVWFIYGLVYGWWRLGLEDRWVEIMFWWFAMVITGLHIVTFLACKAIVAWYEAVAGWCQYWDGRGR